MLAAGLVGCAVAECGRAVLAAGLVGCAVVRCGRAVSVSV